MTTYSEIYKTQSYANRSSSHDNKVSLELSVYVESVRFPTSRRITSSNQAAAFLRTMAAFYDLVINDFSRSAESVLAYLHSLYNTDDVHISYTSGTTLVLDVVISAGLQGALCEDVRRGRLAQALQDRLVTKMMLWQLRLEELSIGVEITDTT